MKIWAYLALASLLVGAATGYTAWVYRKGLTDCQAQHDRAALEAVGGTLARAGDQARVDAGIGLAAATAVAQVTTATETRRAAIARADLTPATPAATGGPDASTACPDVLAGRFVGLFNGTDLGDAPAGPAASPASRGVPGRP